MARKQAAGKPTKPPSDPATPPRLDGLGGFWSSLVGVLPRLKTSLQLVGLVVIVGGFVAYREVPQERVPGVIAAGGIGVLLLIFGQFFRLVERSVTLQDPRFLLGIFATFCVFLVVLFGVSSYFLVPAPQPPVGEKPSRADGVPQGPGVEIAGISLGEARGDCHSHLAVFAKLRNVSPEVHVVKQASLKILQRWRLKPIGISECNGGVIRKSAAYPIPMPREEPPCESAKDISHFVEPNGVDEFGLLPEEPDQEKPPREGEYVYRAKFAVRLDADGKAVESEEFLFMNNGSEYWGVAYYREFPGEPFDRAAHADNMKVMGEVRALPLKISDTVLRVFKQIERAEAESKAARGV